MRIFPAKLSALPGLRLARHCCGTWMYNNELWGVSCRCTVHKQRFLHRLCRDYRRTCVFVFFSSFFSHYLLSFIFNYWYLVVQYSKKQTFSRAEAVYTQHCIFEPNIFTSYKTKNIYITKNILINSIKFNIQVTGIKIVVLKEDPPWSSPAEAHPTTVPRWPSELMNDLQVSLLNGTLSQQLGQT